MKFKKVKRAVELFRELYGSYKGYISILVILGLLGGLLESFGISILVPLFSHILDKPLTEAETITRFFTWFFDGLGIDTRLRFLLPLILFVFIIRAFVLYAFEWVRNAITVEYERAQRDKLYRLLLGSPWSYLAKQRLGFIENTVMVDVEATTNLLKHLTNSILFGSSLLVYVAVALTIDPIVAAVTLIVGGLLLLVFRPLLRRTRVYAGQTVKLNKSIAHDVNESILGLKTIKALGSEAALRDRIAQLFEKLRFIKLRRALVKSTTKVAVQPVSVAFVLAVFAFDFAQPDFNFAVFVVVIFLIQRIFLYVDRMQSVLHILYEGVPFASHIVDLTREVEKAHDTESKGSEKFSFKEKLVFDGVSFGYSESIPALSSTNFSVSSGEMVAIVGPSGSGKTTIVDLMLRLLKPTKGTITLDDVDISDIKRAEWTPSVGYVAQEVFLMNDTIKNNIQFYDDRVTPEDVDYAVQAAHLTPILEKLPGGLESRVGERGTELSGGERQRIALARVLARRPKLLVLDEPTSALDVESEKVIKEALEELKGTITIVVIAHRLDTITIADRALVLREGKIVEEGNPAKLLADADSSFSALYGTA